MLRTEKNEDCSESTFLKNSREKGRKKLERKRKKKK